MAVKDNVALVSVLSNLVLGISKIWVGSTTNSISVLAEGIHSSLDVLSSAISYIGIRVSLKPVDKKHPYGYYQSETVAGLLVSVLILISTAWVLYEGAQRLLVPVPIEMSALALGVMLGSALVNIVLSRLKFKYGTQYGSIALIADARHSEIDVWTSLGVLAGLLLTPVSSSIDGIAGVLVGLVMLKKGVEMGAEITENLLDVSAGEGIESEIKKLAELVPQVSGAYDIKTRKIGANIFAEMSLKVDARLKVEQADHVSKQVELQLRNSIPSLKFITIQIKPLDFRSKSAFGEFGSGFRSAGKMEMIGPQKTGKRTIIPLLDGKEVNEKLGCAEYLVLDMKGEKVVRKEVVKNPYFEPPYGYGAKFAKAIQADIVMVRHVGPNARSMLESQGIEVRLTNLPLKKFLEGFG